MSSADEPTNEDKLKMMSVRQLREILQKRGVDSSDCVEKMDLVRLILKTEKNPDAPAIDLPLEQWLDIFRLLPLSSFGALQRVSRDFYGLANLPSVWRSLLLRSFPPLIKNKVKDEQWKRTFELCRNLDLTDTWRTRFKGLPYVNIERHSPHNVLKMAAFNGICDHEGGPNAFRPGREPPATGIQIGPYFAVVYLVPQVGIISAGIRGFSMAGDMFSGPFLNFYISREFTSAGFAYGVKNREISIWDSEFDAAVDRYDKALPKDIDGALTGTWSCTLRFSGAILQTELLTLRPRTPPEKGEDDPKLRGIWLGSLHRYAQQPTPLTFDRSAIAVAHPNGTFVIVGFTPEWPPSRFWLALCWRDVEEEARAGEMAEGEGEGEGATPVILRGYCLENADSIRWGNFYATSMKKAPPAQ